MLITGERNFPICSNRNSFTPKRWLLRLQQQSTSQIEMPVGTLLQFHKRNINLARYILQFYPPGTCAEAYLIDVITIYLRFSFILLRELLQKGIVEKRGPSRNRKRERDFRGINPFSHSLLPT